jgi:hypothetical protein
MFAMLCIFYGMEIRADESAFASLLLFDIDFGFMKG